MKLNKFALAIALMLPIASVYAEVTELPKCKVVKNGNAWSVTGFTGNKLAGAMTYASSKPEFATVDSSTGVLNVIAAGTTTITATQSPTKKAKGDRKSCSLTLVPATTLTWINDKTIIYAENQTIEVAVASSNSKGTIRYKSDNQNIAEFMKIESGKVFIKIKDGTVEPSNGQHTPVIFTATQDANGAYGAMTATFSLKIDQADNDIRVTEGLGAIVLPSN